MPHAVYATRHKPRAAGTTEGDFDAAVAHMRRKRTYMLVGAACGAMLVILAGLLPTLLVLSHKDDVKQVHNRDLQDNATEVWASICRDAMVGAIAATFNVGGFMMGEIETIPPFNASIPKRLENQTFPKFPYFAGFANTTAEALSLIFIAPGGVVGQTVPSTPLIIGFDILNNYPRKEGWKPPLETILDGQLAVLGPSKSVSDVAQQEEDDMTWVVQIRYPVYGSANISIDNFWGFIYSFLSINELLDIRHFYAWMDAANMDYLMYTYQDNLINAIATSLPGGPHNQSTRSAFIKSGTRREVLQSSLPWAIVVKSKDTTVYLCKKNIAITVVTVVVGAIIVFVIAAAVIVARTKLYDGRHYAPTTVPFAIMTIGPSNAEDLWDLAADQMVETTESLNKVLAAYMERHHAYKIQQMHPYTSSYVLKSVESAVHMAFSVIEELQSRPIDEPLKRLLGEDGQLLLSYAVHWCTDAIVTTDATVNVYRYEGQDMIYGDRMWVFASPNMVTISQQAKAVFTPSSSSSVEIKLFNSVYLRGVAGRQDLFVVTDTTSRRLREAAEGAVLHMQRARELQCQLQEEDEATHSSGEENDSSFYSRRFFGTPKSSSNSTSLGSLHSVQQSQVAAGAAASRFSDRPLSWTHSRSATEGEGTPLMMEEGRIMIFPHHSRHTNGITLALDVTPMFPDGNVEGEEEEEEDSNNNSAFAEMKLTSLVRQQQQRVPPYIHVAPDSGASLEASGILEGVDASSGLSPASTPVAVAAAAAAHKRHFNALRIDVPLNPLAVGLPPSSPHSGLQERAQLTPTASNNGSGSRNSGTRVSGIGDLGPTVTWHTRRRSVISPYLPRRSAIGDTVLGGSSVLVDASGPLVDSIASPSQSLLALQLVRPAIATSLDTTLRASFEQRAVTLDVSYDSVRVIVYFFYVAFKLLFRPLTAQERTSIYKRLVVIFGVPQQDVLENLAACCAVRYLQQHDYTKAVLWDQQLRARLRSHKDDL